MSSSVRVTRQATFNTEPADSVLSDGSIRRGDIQLPVVESSSGSSPATRKRTKNKRNEATDDNNNDLKPNFNLDDKTFVNNDDNRDNLNGHSSSTEHNFYDIGANDVSDFESDFGEYQNFQSYSTQAQNSRTAPESNQSSPIYGSKSEYEKFKGRYAPIKPPPSLYEDSSDLGILSDVGLANDSDCDVVPIVSPLSISAKRKTRKEPRIKIPSSKIDNKEPTIHEETTQDIINTQDSAKKGELSSIPKQIRSGTVIFEKQLEIFHDENIEPSVLNDELGLPDDVKGDEKNKTLFEPTKPRSIAPGNDFIEKNLKRSVSKDSKNENESKLFENLHLLNDDLESSFCESDWQPKKPIKENGRRRSTSPLTVQNAKKHFKLLRQRSADSSKLLKEKQKKLKPYSLEKLHSSRPQSAGDSPVILQSPQEAFTAESVQKEQQVSNTDSLQVASRPQSRTAKTPVIVSNFLVAETHSNEIIENTVLNDLSVEKEGEERQVNVLEQSVFGDKTQVEDRTIVKMETSDGYDYESETFEEILQDRNAMVKAERTYQKRIKQLEDELKGMINQCQALSDENKDLRKMLEGVKKELKEKNESKQDEGTIELTARIAKLETEKENLQKVNEKMSLSMKTDSNKAKQSEAVFVENTKLKSKNSELEKKIQSLQGEVDNLSYKLKNVDASSSGQTAVLEFKKKELEVAVGELKYENKNLTARVKSLENEKHLITNNLEEKRIELNEMMRAMQNETSTESELRQSRAKLEQAQFDMNSVRNELEEMKKLLKESEGRKEKLKNNLSQRDADFKKFKDQQDHKDKLIADLRGTNDKLRGDISKHEENAGFFRTTENELAALKSRIASLKMEIESSISENQRLKVEREEANKEIQKLRTDTTVAADAIQESRKYFRKWEAERDTRNKAEVELAKKQDEVDDLHNSLKECGLKMNTLYGRIRAAEEEKEKFRGPNGQELETNNKILRDENKKLRQMLIERNIELANKTNEKEVLDNRIDILERKQKNSEHKVRQLSGWVDSMNTIEPPISKAPKSVKSHGQNSNSRPQVSNVSKSQTQSSKQSFMQPTHKRTGVKEPIIAVISPRSRKKRVAPSTMTPPPSWDERGNKYNREEGDGVNHTPLSLPLISESTKSQSPQNDFNGGYFAMYKDRMKRMRERHFPVE